jgi:cytochrome c oxidase subunit III
VNISAKRLTAGSSNALLGMWFALAAITMLFVGLTSAYVARRGLDPQWVPIFAPSAALPGCALLIASSVTLAFRWLVIACVLAFAFLAAQITACRELSAAGLYLSTNSHSSFFFMFTVLHGLHVCGGMAALTWAICARRGGTPIKAIALYWHAMTVLWIYLLAVLFTWS